MLLFKFNCHLFNKMIRFTDLVNNEQDIPDIEGYVAAERRIELDIAHSAFPYPVEIDTYQTALGINHGTAGVAAGGVVGRDKADRHLAVITPAAVISACYDITELLGDIVIEYFRIVLSMIPSMVENGM